MSFLAKYPGRWATGAVAVGATYLYIARPPAPRDGPAVTMSTTGVQNIEKAYTNSGATPTHTKAYGGTPLGDKEDVALKEGGGTGAPSKTSPYENEGVGADQRPTGSTTKVEESFNKTNLGSAKGMFTLSIHCPIDRNTLLTHHQADD